MKNTKQDIKILNQRKFYKSEDDHLKPLYAGPIDWEEEDEAHFERTIRIRAERCQKQVGKVITQRGLEGALVLEYLGHDHEEGNIFNIQLKDGTTTQGTWNHYYDWQTDPEGVSSYGWYVGDIRPDPEEGWGGEPFI